MAKLTTQRPQEEIDIITAIGEELVEKLDDQYFTLEGTPSLPVKYPNGAYKTKPLVAGWEYKLESMFLAVNGDPVFQFSPEDSQEYDFVDFKLSKLDDFLPMFGPAFAAAFGVTDLDSPPAIMKRLVADRLSEKAKAEALAHAEAEKAFANNPMFGRFG